MRPVPHTHPIPPDQLPSRWLDPELHEAKPRAEGEHEPDPAARGGCSWMSREIPKDAPLQPPPRRGWGDGQPRVLSRAGVMGSLVSSLGPG